MRTRERDATVAEARGPGGWPARLRLVGGLVALAVTGMAGGALAGYQWSNVTGYRSPYLFEVSPGEGTPALTDRVLLVIVDGLRDDAAASLPTFRRLAQAGVRTTARTTQPSLSFPGWSLITSGAPPEVSGITSNFYEGPVPVASLFTEARRAGVIAAIAGSESWEQLYGDVVPAGYFGGRDDIRSDERIGDEAVRLLREANPGLLVLHLPDADNAGHVFGVDDAYRRNAREADAVVAEVLAAAGPGTTVVYTSDHGHVEQGGHGGPEPEVVTSPLAMAGPGVVPAAAIGPVSHADLAPTMAALLGLPRPGHATGDVLPVLDVDAAGRAVIAEAHARVRARFEEAAAAVLGGARDTLAEAREVRQRRDLLVRAPLALVVMGLVTLTLARATRRVDRRAIAAGVAVFLIVWAALFFGQGLTFSLSHFNTEDQIVPFLVRRLVEAVVAGLAGAAAAGLVVGRGPDPFRAGAGAAAWSMLALAAPVAAFLSVYGWGFTWRLPDLSAAFAEYLLLLGIMGLGVTASIAGLAAVGASRLVSRRRGSG